MIVQVHAVSTSAMMAAVDAGVPLLVHLPNKDFTSEENAKRVAAAGDEGPRHDWLWRARIRRLCGRQPAALP